MTFDQNFTPYECFTPNPLSPTKLVCVYSISIGSVAEFSVVGGGCPPPTFHKIGNLSEIFGFVGILKTIEYKEIQEKFLEREAIHMYM